MLIGPALEASAQSGTTTSIEPVFIHLRNAAPREWSSFPAEAQAEHLEIKFSIARNSIEHSLRLRQQDVKQAWQVLLNGRPLGRLLLDEADIVQYLPIPAQSLIDGQNVLRIETQSKVADDIRVGQIAIDSRPLADVLNEATLTLRVIDKETRAPLPARLTIVDRHGCRMPTAAVSDGHLAARPGVIYTIDGQAHFRLPAGNYTVYASRGFEYSLASLQAHLAPGATVEETLAISREVPTPGYVACDTHIHTFTYSRHGDATLDERLATLAGEAIELPIATDHNAHIDYREHAERLGLRSLFTPVIGNEVTTSVGHFNVFPVEADAPVPDTRAKDWGRIFDQILGTPGVQIAILNHARDLHSNVRPFDPERFNAAVGENIAGWPLRFNAMEVINSGATQTDPLRLPRDWMALLNRGYTVTPVGSSDSHDVCRYIVGQGRTYIRCDDHDVSQLSIAEAVDHFRQGAVAVSYGLLTEITVGGQYKPGDLATLSGANVPVQIRVLGPHWTSLSQVQLYANGQLVREQAIEPGGTRTGEPGVHWQATWSLPRPRHDVHLVAIALGPGIDSPHWATAKPYQPTSPDWKPYTLGISGAVWLDGDGDGRRTAAREYAERLYAQSAGDLPKLVTGLASYDAAIAAQAAHAYREAGGMPLGAEFSAAQKSAKPSVAAGFQNYVEAYRQEQFAQASK